MPFLYRAFASIPFFIAKGFSSFFYLEFVVGFLLYRRNPGGINMEKKSSIFQKGWVLLSLAALCTALWGSASPTIKISYEVFHIEAGDLFSKCLIAGVRFAIAGAIVILFEMLCKKQFLLPAKEEMPRLLGLGLVQTSLQYLLFYVGLAYTTGAKGALFSSIDCFFVVLITPFIIRGQKLTVAKLVGCVLGFGGLVLTSVGTDLSQLAGFSLRGDGAVALSSLCFAMSFFYAKKLMGRMSAQTVTGWQMLLGALVLIAVGLLGGGRMYMGGGLKAFLLLTYLCLLSSVAYTVWSVLMKHNPVNKVSILKLLTPIFGAVFSAALLHETPFTIVNVTALVLVCGGIWMVNREA